MLIDSFWDLCAVYLGGWVWIGRYAWVGLGGCVCLCVGGCVWVCGVVGVGVGIGEGNGMAGLVCICVGVDLCGRWLRQPILAVVSALI